MSDDEWVKKAEEAAKAIEDFSVDLALIRLGLALRAFNPEQPRWPAGEPDGGRWRPVGSSGQGEGTIDVASRIRRGLLAECDEQMESDKDACRASQSELCWSLVLPRYNACIRGDYIPELLHEVPE